jgi:hypothetical protein
MASWRFLTNHGLVLTYLGRHPDTTGLEIAQAVEITERAARKIVSDLLGEGYIEREKLGRRNRYRLNTHLPLPHPAARMVTVGELLGLLWREEGPTAASQGAIPAAPDGKANGTGGKVARLRHRQREQRRTTPE